MTKYTTEYIRQATDAYRDEFVHNIYNDFSDDIEGLFNEKVGEWLTSQFDESDEMEADEIASALCEWVADEMERAEDYHGITYEWSDGGLIYTSDIWDYYRDNKDDCDDCLHEIDLASCDDIDSIVSSVVAIAYSRQAYNELMEATDVIRNGTGGMIDHLA